MSLAEESELKCCCTSHTGKPHLWHTEPAAAHHAQPAGKPTEVQWLMRVLRMAQESMCSGEDMHGVLRLMCLLSLTQGGIAKKHFDPAAARVLAELRP